MKSIIVNTEQLNSSVYPEISAVYDLLEQCIELFHSLDVPIDFDYVSELKLLEKKLISYKDATDQYKTKIKKIISDFERISFDIIKQVKSIEKVEISKSIQKGI